MDIKRGEIYYISSFLDGTGKGRPAVIISNDTNNFHSRSFQIAYLTKKQFERVLPCHVEIKRRIVFYGDNFNADMLDAIILCEHISTVSKDRVLGQALGKLDEDAMSDLNRALSVQLGLSFKKHEKGRDRFWHGNRPYPYRYRH